jgi:signal transduction histidine kinase
MNQQREFISETFHVLAQPITALRATVELGLVRPLNEQTSRQVLVDCLLQVDRLMQDLAVFREIANLDEAPPLNPCDGQLLLQNCVDEMAIVARERGIVLRLKTEPSTIESNEPMFQQGMFVLLDELLASTPSSGEISISLGKSKDSFRLEVQPGIPRGQRQKLFVKLMQFASGICTHSDRDSTYITFRKC